VIASLVAYFLGELTNAIILAKMKVMTAGKHLWSRTIGSSVVAQLVDSSIFVLIAFLGILPNELLISIAVSNYVFKLGLETKIKDIRVFAGGAKKADWDIGMAIDAIAMSEKLDAVVLATGDGDFVPLVEYLKYTQGTQVEVIAFGKSAATSLREAVDDFTDMCEDPKNYLIGYRGGGRWIPGFVSGSDDRSQSADTSPENTEAQDEEYPEGEDPAIKMSGE
jgi:hypothetical protein